MLKCPHCDGAMAPGKLVDHYGAHFAPDGAPRFSLAFKTRVGIKALMCQTCGRIELRGDVEKLRAVLGQ